MRRHFPRLLAALALPVLAAAAGPLTRAPWGEPLWRGGAADLGRGGAGLALLDSTRLGGDNPATFHLGRLTRFQMDFSGVRSRAGDGARQETFSSGQFDGWALGFPLLWKEIHAGLRMSSLSHMDYLLARGGADSLGRADITSLKGSGGLSRAGLVLARAQGRLRVGVELGLSFGSVLEEWKHFYPQSAPPYDSWVERRRSLTGFQGRLGLQWQARPELALALAWTPPARAELTVDLENRANGVDAEILTRRVDLPGELALGAAWRRGPWTWLLDLRQQDWSGTPLLDDSLDAEARLDRPLGVALGLELPASEDFAAPWFRRAAWRAGLRHEEWYARRQDAGGAWRDLRTLCASLGAGIPLKAYGSWLDLTVEAGRAGDAELKDDFVRLRLGLGARDLWFVRPRY
jgi:hypothetical protein